MMDLPYLLSKKSGGPFGRLLWIGIWRDYAVGADTLWAIVTDTRQWALWGPTLKAVRCPHQLIQRGSRGHVLTIAGLWLPFAVDQYHHRQSWYWRVAGIAATGHEVAAGKAGKARLIFWVPAWAWPYTLVCWWALQRIQRLLA